MGLGKSANLLDLVCSQYRSRIEGDLNVIIGITGGPGSGKSSLAQVIAETLRDRYGFKFGANHIYFEPADFLDALSMKRAVVVLDEAGVAINARRFMTELNQVISFTVQTARFRNSVLIFVAPHVRYIDKAVRALIMHLWRVRAIKENGRWVRESKPFIFYTNFITDRISVRPATYLRNGEKFEYPWIRFSKPSEELWQEYMRRKEEWWMKAKERWKEMISKRFEDRFEDLMDKYIQFILENQERFNWKGNISIRRLEYFPWEKYGLPKLSRRQAHLLKHEIETRDIG